MSNFESNCEANNDKTISNNYDSDKKINDNLIINHNDDNVSSSSDRNSNYNNNTNIPISKLVQNLKQEEQDYEFYPTTNEIIKVIKDDMVCNHKHHIGSIMDIGAGNGQTLDKLSSGVEEVISGKKTGRYEGKISKLYAIEKSQILLDQCNSDIIVIGTDFTKSNLIDKKVDAIFCNPPYSEFKSWSKKIIKEANFEEVIYLVIPKRWQDDQEILSLLEKRNLTFKSLGQYDFLQADRKARAEIEIVKIIAQNIENDELNKYSHYSSYKKTIADPFDIFFEETFRFNLKKNDKIDFEGNITDNLKNNQSLIKGEDVIQTLIELYNLDLNNLLSNYRQLEKLDYEIFQELNIKLDNLKEALKLKIENLKTIYWQELFNKLDKIKDKLTTKNRDYISSKIINIADFNHSNIYSIVIWAIKNANKYLKSQLVNLFYELTEPKNIINYKSNQKTWDQENWRWHSTKYDQTHFKLDYRIIIEGTGSYIESDYNNKPYKERRLVSYNGSYSGSSNAYNLLNDIKTNANNLGFNVNYIPQTGWEYGKKREIYYFNSLINDNEVLMEVKLFKNGNIHLKFNQEFIKKLNIEVSRLKGWIRSPKQAQEEMNLKPQEAQQYFNSLKLIEKSNLRLLA